MKGGEKNFHRTSLIFFSLLFFLLFFFLSSFFFFYSFSFFFSPLILSSYVAGRNYDMDIERLSNAERVLLEEETKHTGKSRGVNVLPAFLKKDFLSGSSSSLNKSMERYSNFPSESVSEKKVEEEEEEEEEDGDGDGEEEYKEGVERSGGGRRRRKRKKRRKRRKGSLSESPGGGERSRSRSSSRSPKKRSPRKKSDLHHQKITVLVSIVYQVNKLWL